MKCSIMPALAALGFPHIAMATAYDDCILQHMAGAREKTAVYAIERACISQSSVEIDPFESKLGEANVTASVGLYNLGSGQAEPSIVFTFKNNIPFDVTEVLFMLTEIATGKMLMEQTLHSFIAPIDGPGFFGEVPEPGSSNIIGRGQTATFGLRLVGAQPAPDFFKRYSYSWNIKRGISHP